MARAIKMKIPEDETLNGIITPITNTPPGNEEYESEDKENNADEEPERLAQVSARFEMPVKNLPLSMTQPQQPRPSIETPAPSAPQTMPYAIVDDGIELDVTERFMQQLSQEESVRAHVYRIPERILNGGQIPDRLPPKNAKHAWPRVYDFPFNYETYEDEVFQNCEDGTYWLDIRKRGQISGLRLIVCIEKRPGDVTAPVPPVLTQQATAPAADPLAAIEPTLILLERLETLRSKPAPPQTQDDSLAQLDRLLSLKEKLQPEPSPESEFSKTLQQVAMNQMLEAVKTSAQPVTEAAPWWTSLLAPLIEKALPIGLKVLDNLTAPQTPPAPAQPKPVTYAQKQNPAPVHQTALPASDLDGTPDDASVTERTTMLNPMKMLEALANGIRLKEEIEQHAQKVYDALSVPIVGRMIGGLVETPASELLEQIREALPGYRQIADLPHAEEWLNSVQARVYELANEDGSEPDEE